MSVITSDHIQLGLSFDTYLKLSEQLFNEQKTTSEAPSYNTPEILEYTRLNLQRMRRLDKTVQIDPTLIHLLNSLTEDWIWLVLTESWCGDAAQIVPVIAAMAEESEYIALRLLLRDKHLDVMDAYLTNGGRAIPKLICLKADTLEEVGQWGPRPASAQSLVMEAKKNKVPFAEFNETLHTWYAKDKTHSIQQEFIGLLKQWLIK